MSEEKRKMIVEASKDILKRMASANAVKMGKPEISQLKADEDYIIELFTITENQAAEIRALKAAIAEQKAVIEKLRGELKGGKASTKRKTIVKKVQQESR